MKRVVLGVSSSIAAYKAASIITELIKFDVDVHVVMTKNSTAFITPLALQALSNNPVHTEIMAEPVAGRINHIDLAQSSDLLIVAPATANVIGKIANGIADDMLTTVCLATPSSTPRFIAPAMNTFMYENQVVTDNLTKLQQYGYEIIVPESKRLACGDVGMGALASVSSIVAQIIDALNQKKA